MAGEISKMAREPQTLQTVSQSMAKLAVSGLPRNYELFHEALSGSDTALLREVRVLPAAPSQALLDEIGLRHQLPGFVAIAATSTRHRDIQLLSDLKAKMAEGATQKQGFVRVLENVARSLREDSNAGPADILAEIEYLSVSLSDSVVAETELSEALKTGVERLAKAEREASAARTVTLRDRLTSLPNHAALAERLEKLYGAEGNHADSALFLVTIPDLGDLSRVYGEQTAQRIIRKAATIFRKAIKKNDFLARIGIGDFAFLFRDVNRDSVQPIADRLIASIAENLVFAASDRTNSTLDISIGVALATDAFTPLQLRQQAAAALDTAKVNPRLALAIYSEMPRRTA